MKVLITGANGFIGKYLSDKFGNSCISTTRKLLDLSNRRSVDEFFWFYGTFDAIIHCAVRGGRRTVQYGPEILYENLLAFENLSRYIHRTKVFVSYSSGAEFTIDNGNYYGMSKHIISQRLKQYNNAVNIRIYNCFGEAEEEQRFIKTCIRACLKNEDITIFKNKFMDFFYIQDLYTLTNAVISSENKFNTIDSVYCDKMTLEDVAKYIRNATNSQSNIIIEEDGFDAPYIGNGALLKSLQLPIVGFNTGIHNTIEYMKNEGITI